MTKIHETSSAHQMPEAQFNEYGSSAFGHFWTVQTYEMDGLIQLLNDLWDWICSLFESETKAAKPTTENLKTRVTQVQPPPPKEGRAAVNKTPKPVINKAQRERFAEWPDREDLKPLIMISRGPNSKNRGEEFQQIEKEFDVALLKLYAKIKNGQKIEANDPDLLKLEDKTAALSRLERPDLAERISSAQKVISDLKIAAQSSQAVESNPVEAPAPKRTLTHEEVAKFRETTAKFKEALENLKAKKGQEIEIEDSDLRILREAIPVLREFNQVLQINAVDRSLNKAQDGVNKIYRSQLTKWVKKLEDSVEKLQAKSREEELYNDDEEFGIINGIYHILGTLKKSNKDPTVDAELNERISRANQKIQNLKEAAQEHLTELAKGAERWMKEMEGTTQKAE
ncbi:MAG: hypothetical protein JSS30_07835 [Verrucomicrobia bacterium]|nr:hypothetical protein [Verrucomicrobiota bacterium]